MQNLMSVMTRKFSPRAEGIFLIFGGAFLAAVAVGTTFIAGAEPKNHVAALIGAASAGAYWYRAYVLLDGLRSRT